MVISHFAKSWFWAWFLQIKPVPSSTSYSDSSQPENLVLYNTVRLLWGFFTASGCRVAWVTVTSKYPQRYKNVLKHVVATEILHNTIQMQYSVLPSLWNPWICPWKLKLWNLVGEKRMFTSTLNHQFGSIVVTCTLHNTGHLVNHFVTADTAPADI